MRTMILIVATLMASHVAWSADTGKSDAAIRERMASVEAALNKKDAAAYAACFTPDGDRIGLASPISRGRAEIAAAAKSMIAGWPQNQSVKFVVRSIRYIGSDVALAEADHLFSAGTPRQTRGTWTLTRQKGQWLVASSRIYEAESAAPTSAAPTLPIFTLDQRWERLEFHFASLAASAVAHAKSKGESLEAYAHFTGKLFAPTWPQVLTPFGLLRGYYANASSWKNLEAQLLSATETSATLRVNRPWANDLGPTGSAFGLSADDLDTFLRIIYEDIATSRGLVFEQRRDGEHLIVTARRK
jgi:uncharacterized protein (TIGR02246 family)